MGGSNSGEAVVTAGTREQSRDSMMMSGTVRRAGSNAPAVAMRVRNISSGGMMGEAEITLSVGETVELSLKSIGQITGTVAWADDDRIGIAFAVPVDRLRVRRNVTVNVDRAVPAQPSSRRPGLRTA